MKRPIVPSEMRGLYEDWRMSPGLECGGFIFLTLRNATARFDNDYFQ